jgi:hypothetical protein
MRLTTQQSRVLLMKYSCYVMECCDRCTQLLGPVRYTCKSEAGEWCSRECRDGREAHAPKTCKHCHAALPTNKRRGALFCDDACRKPHSRVAGRNLSRPKPSVYAAFCSVPKPGSYRHSRQAQSALETPGNATFGVSPVRDAESREH